MPAESVVLALVALVASVVTGALGYGFSSITVPVALLVVSSRVLNPALVAVEVVMNAYVLWTNRGGARAGWRYVRPLLPGLLPGIVIGVLVLSHVSTAGLQLFVYATLLPLILLQAAGYRRPIALHPASGTAMGGGIGVLYATTTISGPPLALFLANQGLVHREFRAALGWIRLAESTLTAIAYWWAGLFTPASLGLLRWIAPGVALGVPAGALLIRHVGAESFRRVCMGVDAAIVAFGLSRVLQQRGWVDGRGAAAVIAGVVAVDLWLLLRYLRERAPVAARPPYVESPR